LRFGTDANGRIVIGFFVAWKQPKFGAALATAKKTVMNCTRSCCVRLLGTVLTLAMHWVCLPSATIRNWNGLVPKQYISETFDIFFIYKEMHTRTHIQSTDNILQCEP
jgi:hypothetical protein